MTPGLSFSLLRWCHDTFNIQGDVSREAWKLHKAEGLRVVTYLSLLSYCNLLQFTSWVWVDLHYQLLIKFVFTQRTSGLKICTKKPWIEDNSDTTNNNKTIELTFLVVALWPYLSGKQPKKWNCQEGYLKCGLTHH